MKRYILVLGLIGVLLVGITGFFITKKMPFGFAFNLSLILSITGLVGLLVYAAFRWIRKSLFKKLLAITFGSVAIIITVVVIVSVIDIRLLMPAVSSKTLTKDQWIDDLEFLEKALQQHPAYQKSPDFGISNYKLLFDKEEKFNEYDALRTAMNMVSAFDDGHSNVMPFQLYFQTRYLPIQTFVFEDGVYITESRDKDLVGAKIISINNHKVNPLLESISTLIGADNPGFSQYQSGLYIPNLDVLRLLGRSVSTEKATIKVVLNGKEITKTLSSVSMLRWLFWSLTPDDDWRPVGHNIRNQDNRLSKKNDTLLYLTFNQTGPRELLVDIANRMKKELGEGKIKHLVLDLRNNTGGDNTSYNELNQVLSESKIEITLFTSRKTFSAGINFISELQLKRPLRIIGEPTGAGHNHYGDAKTIFLPNSGLMLSISTREWSFIPDLTQKSIDPDIWINYSSSDYFNYEDPWMTALE